MSFPRPYLFLIVIGIEVDGLHGRLMVHRYATFEIDEAARELRAGDRVLALQPRVFDLLVYLARNCERVVPKDELLTTVWPGVLVTDGSLQRAVSLARTALAQAGARNAIRTHPRQGYRFRVEAGGPATDPVDARLAAGRAACARGDWDGVIRRFREIDSLEDLTTDDLQSWAQAAQCSGRPDEAILPLERAVATFRTFGDRRRAAWAAILIAQLRLEWREPALANGWFQRADRLLNQEGPCREKGYLHLVGARMALMRNELEQALQHAHFAQDLGERFDDADLAGLGLAYGGEAALYLGRIREGVAALDEAGVAVVADGLSPWAGGQVYCCVIFSSMNRTDWVRAVQWTEQFTRWCAGKGLAGYPGLCRLHRSEVLAVHGDLDAAEAEARATIQHLARQVPWAEGEAWRVLGDVLVAKGAFAEARAAFGKATQLGWESQFGLSLLSLAEGNPAVAARLLRRTLADNAWSTRIKRGQALAYYALAAAAAGDVGDARRALADIEAEPELVSTQVLQALVARAQAEVRAAEGFPAEAIVLLRAAVRDWQAAAAPILAAQARCRLAELLDAEGDEESAALERNAAATVFERAGAGRLVGSCERLRRALAARGRADRGRMS